MIQGDWWIFPDGKAAEMGGSEHAVVARREMMKLAPSDYMATWNIMKSLDDDELRLARSRGADEEALAFLMQSGPDPRWYAMKNWGWIRVHTNRKKGETYFQTLLFDLDSLEVIRGSEFWRAQPKSENGDWVIVEDLSTKKLHPMTAGKLRRGDPDEVLGRVPTGRPAGALSYREIQQMYPSRENPPKLSKAQVNALHKFAQPGGHGYGEYAYLERPTAKALERLGLVRLGYRELGGGRSMSWGETTEAGRAVLEQRKILEETFHGTDAV